MSNVNDNMIQEEWSVGEQVQVSQTIMTQNYGYMTDAHQDFNPQITALEDGSQVVVWQGTHDIFDEDGNKVGTETNIYARVYDADGNAVGEEISLGKVGEQTPWGSDSAYDGMPSVTATEDGGFAIAWSAYEYDYDENGAYQGSSSDIYVQSFNATGEAKGAALQVSETVMVEQYGYQNDAHQDFDPKITSLPGGGTVVVWSGSHQDFGADGEVVSAASNIYARAYDQDGEPMGELIELGNVSETPYGAYDAAYDGGAEVTALADGGFAITWQAYESTYDEDGSYQGNSSDIYVQSFNADASEKSDAIKVSDTIMEDNYGYQNDAQNDYNPEIVSLANGGYVVVWEGNYYSNQNGIYESESSVLAQVFDENGSAIGSQINLGEVLQSPWGGDAAYDGSPSITALNEGGFAIAWASNKTEYDADGMYLGNSSDIFVQTFNDEGVSLGETIQASETGANSYGDYAPEIAALDDGGFAVVWQGNKDTVGEDGQSVNESNIYARAFDADGAPVTDEISMGEVAATPYGYDSAYDGAPQITTLPDGGFTVAWSSWKSEYGENGEYLGSSSDIHMQTITPPPAPEPAEPEFVLTGFEAADLSQASETVLNDWGSDQHYDNEPEVVGLADGGYVVVWRGTHFDQQEDGTNTSEQNVYARTYDSDGNQVSDVISIGEVNLSQWGSDYASDFAPSVTAADDGGFIVAWQTSNAIIGENGYAIGNTRDIMTQSFNADGSAKGEATQISQTQVYEQSYGESDMYVDEAPEITTLADGSYVVVWHGQHSDLDDTGASTFFETAVYARLFNANGEPMSDEISLSAPENNPWGNDLLRDTEASVTALEDGGFAIAWQTRGSAYDQDGNALGQAEDIYVQSFDAAGHPEGAIQQVSETVVADGSYGDSNSDTQAEIIGLANGGYVVAWSGQHQDNETGTIAVDAFAKVYDANGNEVSGELTLGTQSGQWGFDGHQDSKPQLSALSGGGFVVTWESIRNDYDPETGASSYSSDIMSQIFDDNGVALGAPAQVSQTVMNNAWGSENDTYGDWEPQTTALEDGGYVIVWRGVHDERDGEGMLISSEANIYARAFDADGNAMAQELSLGTVSVSDFGDDQSWDSIPSVSALENGGFVIAWENQSWGMDPSTGQYQNSSDIMVQKFDATYEEVVVENPAPQPDPQPQPEPDPEPQPEPEPEPEPVVDPVESEGLNVFSLKMVDQASETRLHDDYGYARDDHEDYDGTVHALAGGGYVVVWTGRHTERDADGMETSVENNVFMKVYGAEGQALSDVVSIGTVAQSPWGADDAAYDSTPSVAAHSDGGFSVVWSNNTSSYSEDGMSSTSTSDIMMQTFDATGSATTDVTQLSTTNMGGWSGYQYDTHYDYNPQAVSLADGSTVIVWQGDHGDTDQYGNLTTQEANLYAKIISPDGTMSDELTMGENVMNIWGYDSAYDSNAKITALEDGGFAISWDVGESITDEYGAYTGYRNDIHVQAFNADGTPKGESVQASTTNMVDQWGYQQDANWDWGSEITALSDGGFVVTWGGTHNEVDEFGNTTASESNVYVRTFDADGNPTGEEMSLGDVASTPWGYDNIQDSMPKITALSAGGFAIAWQEYRNDYDEWGGYLGNSSDVMMQIFGSDGLPTGEPIKATETVMVEQWGSQTDAHQDSQPVITELADGSLALAWQGYHMNEDSVDGYSATYENDIFIKVFDTEGEALTPELSISESEGTPYGSDASYDSMPSIVALDNGGFSVAWQTWEEHYDADGNWQGYSSDVSVAEVSVGDHSTDSNDYVIGTDGDDVIIGGAKDDMLVGGEGQDTFVFNEGDGFDVIVDFEAGEGSGDVIDLSSRGFTSFAELMENAQQVDDEGVVIDLGEDQGILLENVQVEDLHEDDFMI